MKFALHFGNIICPKPEEAKRLGRLAEAAGFESIIAVEHIVIPSDYATRYPYDKTGRLPGDANTDWPDPLAWLTFVGAVTTKIRLITGVVVLPQRNPVILAKHLATIDSLTNGRLELGVGAGWLREEFNALSVPFEERGRRMEEYIEAMRKLWTENDASFAGDFVNFDKVNCNPKPSNGHVPIIIGGHSKRAARRAANIGNGFFPATGIQTDLKPILGTVREEAAKIGRNPNEIAIITGCPEIFAGSKHDMILEIEKRKNLGVSRIALPLNSFLPDLEKNFLDFSERVIKQFQ